MLAGHSTAGFAGVSHLPVLLEVLPQALPKVRKIIVLIRCSLYWCNSIDSLGCWLVA